MISIIIPMYNAGKNICRCLKSISKQSYSDFEIIIIDDGSKDNSFDIAKKYIENNPILREKTRLIKKDNEGAALTRNYGISLAKGDYVAFIDQDDIISCDYLEKYYSATKNRSYDIIYGGYERVSEEGKILFRIVPSESEWGRYIVVSPWAHLYKRDFVVNNKIEFLTSKIGEDIYFNVVAINCTANYKVIDDRGYKWIYNTKSVSNSIQNTINDDVDITVLLDGIYTKIAEIGGDTESSYLEYFCLRYACWYFLFSTRGSKKYDIDKTYVKVFEWLKSHFSKYRKNPFIGLKKPKGEKMSFHIYVMIFYFCEKIGVLKSVLKMFGKN